MSSPLTWQEGKEGLVAEMTFKDFREALLFVNAVGYLAEAANHHPDVTISWNRVKLVLITHSENRITEKDRKLASQIEALLSRRS